MEVSEIIIGFAITYGLVAIVIVISAIIESHRSK